MGVPEPPLCFASLPGRPSLMHQLGLLALVTWLAFGLPTLPCTLGLLNPPRPLLPTESLACADHSWHNHGLTS